MHRGMEDLQTTFYGLDFLWYDFLKKSPYVTNDTAAADYFYFPCEL